MIKIFIRFVAILSAVVISTASLSASRFNLKHFQITQGDTLMWNVDDTISAMTIEVRAAVNTNKERVGLSKSKWGVVWDYQSSNNFKIIEITWNNTNYGDFADTRQLVVRFIEVTNGERHEVNTSSLERGIDLSTGLNSVLLEVESSKFNLFVGKDKYQYIGTFYCNNTINGMCGVYSTVDASVENFVVETIPDMCLKLKTDYTQQNLREKFSVRMAAHEGFWCYLDRDNNPDWAKLGGRYNIALIKENDDYLIVYLSGAETNSSNWNEGMIKGRLKATIFQNHYDLEWYDSMFELIDNDAHASIVNSILILEFPLYKTKIRFFRQR